MVDQQPAAARSSHDWRGIHHIALATPDLDATLRFYSAVLGMQVSEIFPAREGRGRHCLVFAKLDDADSWGLHFFERAGASVSSQPATLDSALTASSPLLHIAFRLAGAAAASALRDRLAAAEVAITDIPELGTFVFSDNNGILLEATWPAPSG